MFGTLDEVEDIPDFIAHGDLFGNLEHCILQAEVACVDDAVGVGNMAQDAIGSVHMLKHYGVHTVVCSRVSTENHVRRYVLLHAATALHK